MKIDLKELSARIAGQFQGLSGRHPGMWPLVPRVACALGVAVGVTVLGYFLYWSGQFEDQQRGAAEETKLREEYRVKIAQAINLEALRKQRVLVDKYVEQMEKQLPSKAEMDALLADVNQAGVGRGLHFELFKPGQVVVRDYYAELPITIRISGGYHDIGAFASDMAKLPRIVTLNDMNIAQDKNGGLTLDAVAKTYRYLDADEAAKVAKEKADAKAKAKKGAKGGGT